MSRDFFLPRDEASIPDTAPPMMHPISALDAVNPCSSLV